MEYTPPTCLPPEGVSRDIGSILTETGKMTPADLEQIVALQQKKGMLFGEAAIELGILTEEDVQVALASQFSYPYLSNGQSTMAKEVLAIQRPFSPQAENFRSIRSELLLSGVGKIIKTMAVISSSEREGKTFIAANLAATFAQLGSKTILVDMNFRNPRIHEIFNIKNNCGISSAIIKRATIDQAVNCTAIPSLHILPSGPKPPNPLELLGWDETREIISFLKNAYDVVIIDTPSFFRTADALVTSSMCDGVVIIALKGNTKKEAFSKIKKQLTSSKTRIIGALINEPDKQKQNRQKDIKRSMS